MNEKLLERLDNWATYFRHGLVGEKEWHREDEQAYQQIKSIIEKQPRVDMEWVKDFMKEITYCKDMSSICKGCLNTAKIMLEKIGVKVNE